MKRLSFLAPVLLAAACSAGPEAAPPADFPPPRAVEVGPPEQAAAATESSPTEVTEPGEPEKAPAPSEPPAPKKAGVISVEDFDARVGDVPGANLSVGNLEADGLVCKNIACKTDGSSPLGLLGIPLVTAWIAPRKKELDACAPAGSETRITWKASSGKLLEVKAAGGDKTRAACVERALAGGKPVLDGHCAATIVHGTK